MLHIPPSSDHITLTPPHLSCISRFSSLPLLPSLYGGSIMSFEAFLEGWMVRQEHYLDELLSAQQNSHESRDEDLEGSIARVLSHYQQYYHEKSRAAQRNVFLVFSPTWFTAFERTFLWIPGFKPGLAFRIVTKSMDDLSEDQTRRINRAIEETKVEERILADDLARIQESVAAAPMLELARRMRSPVDGEILEEDAAVELLRSAMESVLASADFLRLERRRRCWR